MMQHTGLQKLGLARNDMHEMGQHVAKVASMARTSQKLKTLLAGRTTFVTIIKFKQAIFLRWQKKNQQKKKAGSLTKSFSPASNTL